METNTISLTKGVKVDLSKEAPGLKHAILGLGWDTKEGSAPDFDLDASVFMLNASGKLTDQKNFIYFKNLTSPCGSVIHSGDNLTGAGEGDDETVSVELDKVPADVNELAFIVNIYEAKMRNQNFGQVKNAFIRISDKTTGQEILRYDLSEDFSAHTAVLFGRLYRHNGAWKFEASGVGETSGLDAFVQHYQ